MHLSSEEALDIVESRATEDQVRFWSNHAQVCPDCRKQLAYWKEMHSVLKRENLESAPQASIRMAQAIFKPQPAETRPGIRNILASLVFDSFAQPALAGARGANLPHQFLLSALEFDIHVRLWESEEGRRMTGQILSRKSTEDLQSVQVHLLQDGKRLSSTDTDASGEFEFDEVPDGPLYLQIDLPRLSITGALKTE